MLSVQNMHLAQGEDTNEFAHAARRGGSRRPARRSSNGGRWALGAGAATAGIAIMGRTKLGRKVTRKIVRSKALRSVRKGAVVGLRKLRSTSAVRTARRFVGARKASMKRIGTAARGAASRVAARVKAKTTGAFGRIKAFGTRVKRAATGVRKRASIRVGRATRGTSRSTSRVRRYRSSGGGNRR